MTRRRPAATPAKMLRVPATLKTRRPPMLYCVVALTALPVSVPPAVPWPEMLKLLDACYLLCADM